MGGGGGGGGWVADVVAHAAAPANTAARVSLAATDIVRDVATTGARQNGHAASVLAT